jgi:hypothetical protein
VALILFGLLLTLLKYVATSKRLGSGSPKAPLSSAIGGGIWFGRWWITGLTWPFARLDVYDWGVRIGPSFKLIGWALPTTDYSWPEMLWVRQVRTRGIDFKGRSSDTGLSNAVIDEGLITALHEHGVAFERSR